MLKQLKEGVRDWLRTDDETNLSDISLYYSYQDLSEAAGFFKSENRLGAGAAGAVYRGWLRGGTEVAIKVLVNSGGLGGFEDEVRVLTRFRHPNLVTLLGWGQNWNERYLVYELLTGGDVGVKLEKCREGRGNFGWQQRLRVALDAACGLSHMLNSSPKAFHRDIKPANILLDANGGAKMADFGLAGTIRDPERHHLTVENISGTPGYACPVYIQTGRVSEQSEVYSFGMVLLEFLVNQPPALAGPQGDIIYPLLQTVQPAAPGAHGRLLKNLDPRAGWTNPVVDQFAELALRCVDMVPERRPLFESLVMVLRRLATASSAGAPAGGGFGTPPTMSPRYDIREQTPPSAAAGGGYPAVSKACGSCLPAEIVLSCARADGVDLGALPTAHRCMAFAVDVASANGRAAGGGWCAPVGRQHQSELFDRLVPNKERLGCISRTHFVLYFETPEVSTPRLRKLSWNSLFLDARPLQTGETAQLQEGSCVSFSGTSDANPCFLVFRLKLRSAQQVYAEGQHPAAAAAANGHANLGAGSNPAMSGLPKRSSFQVQQAAAPSPQAPPPAPCPSVGRPPPPVPRAGTAVTAVLECVGALGADLQHFEPETRAIALPLQDCVEVGRQQQVGFFENLLHAEPSWLTFISRTHCRVYLSVAPPPPGGGGVFAPGTPHHWLRVENVSTNPIFVCGRPVTKGTFDTMPEGGVLTFRAKGKDERHTNFLELKLRRARRQFR